MNEIEQQRDTVNMPEREVYIAIARHKKSAGTKAQAFVDEEKEVAAL